MKHFTKFCMLMSAMVLICSCNALDELGLGHVADIESVTMTAHNFVLDGAGTRTSVELSNQGANFVWTASDVVGVFPNQDDATQVKFPIADGDVEGGTATSSANFTGKGWAVMKANTYAAYYPFVPDMNLDKKAIPVTYLGQKQKGNNDAKHVSDYDYMAATPTEPSSNGNIGFDFKHLGSLFQFVIPVPKKGTYKTLTMKCEDVPFITDGHVDITSEKPQVVADACDNCFVIELDQVQTTREGESLIINVLLPPVDMSGHKITLRLQGPNAEFETSFTPSKPFQPGTAYRPNLPAVEGGDVVKLMNGEDFNTSIKSFVNNDTYLYEKPDYKIKKIAFEVNNAAVPELPYIDVSAPQSPASIYAIWDESTGTLTIRTSVAKVFANEDARGMFNELEGLTSFDQTGFSTNYATSISEMFRRCVEIQSLDLSSFETENIENMRGLFDGCIKLTQLNTTGFNTAKTTNMSCMFKDCRQMTQIDITHFNMSSLTDISEMFSECHKLTNIKFNQSSTNSVMQNLYSVFNNCPLLPTVDLRWLNTSNVWEIRGAFYGCEKLESIVGDLTITNKVWSLDRVFVNCKALKALNTSEWDVSNCKGEHGLMGTFTNCASLTTLDVSNWILSEELTHLYGTFDGCSSLASLDITKWDTQNIVSFGELFRGCSSLTSLDVTKLKTGKCKDFHSMFANCSKLQSLDLSNFDTREANYMYSMFAGCSELSRIDISSFSTPHVINMSQMFCDCSKLKEIVWGSKFDTHYCTSFSGMFRGSGFETLDLTHFNTESAQDMSDLFTYMPNLKQLNISTFNTSRVNRPMDQLFRYDSKLEQIDLGPNFRLYPGSFCPFAGMGRDATGTKTIKCSEAFMNEAVNSQYDGDDIRIYNFVNAQTGESMTPPERRANAKSRAKRK